MQRHDSVRAQSLEKLAATLYLIVITNSSTMPVENEISVVRYLSIAKHIADECQQLLAHNPNHIDLKLINLADRLRALQLTQ